MDTFTSFKLRLLKIRASWDQLSISKKSTLSLMVLALLVFPSAYLLSQSGINLYGRASEPITYPNPTPTPVASAPIPHDPARYMPLAFDQEIRGEITATDDRNPLGFGRIDYYKITLPPLSSYNNVEIFFRSCSSASYEQPWYSCYAGAGFSEESYIFDSQFRPIQPQARFNTRIDFDNITITEDKSYYIVVGPQDGGAVGKYKISLNYEPNPFPPTPTPTFPPTPTPICHTGIKQLRARVECGSAKHRFGSVICWDNSRFEIGTSRSCYSNSQLKTWANNKCANIRYCEPVPTLAFPTVTPAPTRTPTPTVTPTPTPVFH